MKTFQRFIIEVSKYKDAIGADEYSNWQKEVDEYYKKYGHTRGVSRRTINGVTYEMRNKARAGNPRVYGVDTEQNRQASAAKRIQAEKEGELSQDELRGAAGGDEERSSLALDTERTGIKKLIGRVKRSSRLSGEKKSVGHKVPLQPDDPNAEDPGHVRSNTGMEPLSPNASKGNKRPEPGEPGYGLTRSQAIQDADRRGVELGQKIDREVALTQSGKESRAARLLSYLRRPKPKDTGAVQRMSAAYDKMNQA